MPGGALEIRGASIGENLKSDGARWIVMGSGWDVGKDVQIRGTTGVPRRQQSSGLDFRSNFICDGEIVEKLQLIENSDAAPFVVGDNNPLPTFQGSDLVKCDGGTVVNVKVGKELEAIKNGNLSIANTDVDANLQVFESRRGVVEIRENDVADNLQVYNNAILGGGVLRVDDNTVGQNLQVFENDDPLGGEAGVSVSGNKVGLDLQVEKNMSFARTRS